MAPNEPPLPVPPTSSAASGCAAVCSVSTLDVHRSTPPVRRPVPAPLPYRLCRLWRRSIPVGDMGDEPTCTVPPCYRAMLTISCQIALCPEPSRRVGPRLAPQSAVVSSSVYRHPQTARNSPRISADHPGHAAEATRAPGGWLRRERSETATRTASLVRGALTVDAALSKSRRVWAAGCKVHDGGRLVGTPPPRECSPRRALRVFAPALPPI